MQNRLKFSYWSDALCIWAFVAQQKLGRVFCWRRAMPSSSWAPAAAIKAVLPLAQER
jgi:hypothetical protein